MSNSVDDTAVLTTVWKPDISSLSAKALQSSASETQDPDTSRFHKDLQRAAVNAIHDTLAQLTPKGDKSLEWHHSMLVCWTRGPGRGIIICLQRDPDEAEKVRFYQRVASKSVNWRSHGWRSQDA